ncbi:MULTISPECIES: phosphate signaling complex protein PhoU [unclassified Moraxella]|uniref:phosphate signaling complex protein PhoU n=1 Tax=unclassified Moraxella TaxID=2685852 RepID=UPI003AF5B3BD
MNLIGEHLSKSYDQDLQSLMNHFLHMGGMAEANLVGANQALQNSDLQLAERIIEADRDINLKEQELDDMVVKVLARRQPAATDLRLIMAISKCGVDIERIGDEAKKIAKMVRRISRDGQLPIGYHEAHQMGLFVQQMLKNALEAFAKFDTQQAYQAIKQDDEIDAMYKSSSRAVLTYVMEDGRYVAKVIDVMWVLRSLERIGAHARNIAEQLIFCITGEDVRYQKSLKAKEVVSEFESTHPQLLVNHPYHHEGELSTDSQIDDNVNP